MNEQDIQEFLTELSGVNDFTLELKQSFSKEFWGRYYPQRKFILLYALDENGEQYPDDILIREATHELAHHLQFHHVPEWEGNVKTAHDDLFYELHKALLDKAFGRKVPEKIKYRPVVEKIVASRK